MTQTSNRSLGTTWWPTIGVLAAIVLSAAGLCVSALLLQHHVAIAVGGDPLLSSMCEISEHSSCDAVLSSEWAKFHGVPTALLGWLFFSCLFAWYLVIGQPSPTRRGWQVLPLLATAAGTGICVGLAFFMYTRLPQWCPLCAITHGLTALLFILTVLLWQRAGHGHRLVITRVAYTSDSDERRVVAQAGADFAEASRAQKMFVERPTARQFIVTVLLATAIGVAGSSEYYRALHKASAAEYKKQWQAYESDLQMVYNRYLAEPEVDIPVGSDDSIRGERDAKHTLVMFGDLQCEFCRTAEKMVREKFQQNPGRIRIVFKHYPMNSKCNQYVKSRVHIAACEAAKTVEAARELGGEDAFWKMHDAIFDDQAGFGRKPEQFVHDICQKLKLDEEKLYKAIRSASILARVPVHTAQAHDIGVTATPALYLDGRRLQGWSLGKFWDYIFFLDKQKEKQTGASAPNAASRPATPTLPARSPTTRGR